MTSRRGADRSAAAATPPTVDQMFENLQAISTSKLSRGLGQIKLSMFAVRLDRSGTQPCLQRWEITPLPHKVRLALILCVGAQSIPRRIRSPGSRGWDGRRADR